MKYVAYGSNMALNQMKFRCPDAKLIGMGILKNARLEFFVHATVVPFDGDTVPVAVFEISKRDEHNLDIYEGFPKYYIKEQCTVSMANGSSLQGMVYVMKHIRNALPTRTYFNGIMGAYQTLGIASQIDSVLYPALKRAEDRE